jgi:hypothetical protein
MLLCAARPSLLAQAHHRCCWAHVRDKLFPDNPAMPPLPRVAGSLREQQGRGGASDALWKRRDRFSPFKSVEYRASVAIMRVYKALACR